MMKAGLGLLEVGWRLVGGRVEVKKRVVGGLLVAGWRLVGGLLVVYWRLVQVGGGWLEMALMIDCEAKVKDKMLHYLRRNIYMTLHIQLDG